MVNKNSENINLLKKLKLNINILKLYHLKITKSNLIMNNFLSSLSEKIMDICL